ncbi:hypothetical protein U1Q18_033961 [Sarracenia purpurea var. burkii]
MDVWDELYLNEFKEGLRIEILEGSNVWTKILHLLSVAAPEVARFYNAWSTFLASHLMRAILILRRGSVTLGGLLEPPTLAMSRPWFSVCSASLLSQAPIIGKSPKYAHNVIVAEHLSAFRTKYNILPYVLLRYYDEKKKEDTISG